MNDGKLTIFIPSYNRPEKALQTLLFLCDQLQNNVFIKVLDNHSHKDYKGYFLETNPSLLNIVEAGQLEFIRHEQNIGMSANFMRTFELCKTEWLWVVSDDDEIHEGAIENILDNMNKVAKQKNVAFIKFSAKVCFVTEENKYLNNLNELIEMITTSDNYFNSYIFLTNGLYRMPYFKPEVETGYQYCNTYVPHLMMVISCMAKLNIGAKIYCSPNQVVTYTVPKMGYSYGLLAGLGVGAFKNFTYNLSRNQLKRLEGAFAPHNDFKVAIDLYYQCKYQANVHVARRLMSNYYLQTRCGRNILQMLVFRLFLTLFYVPKFFEFILNRVRSIVPLIDTHVVDIIKRYKK